MSPPKQILDAGEGQFRSIIKVSRSSGLAKTALQGTERGARRRGSQLKEAVGRQPQRVDRTGLSRVTEGRGRQTEMEAAGCDGETTSESGQGWTFQSHRGLRKTYRGGGSWLWWEDNVGEWTGLDFPESRRTVEDRQRWRQLVVVGRQPQRVDRTGLSRVTEGRGRQTEMEAAGCEITAWCCRVEGEMLIDRS